MGNMNQTQTLTDVEASKIAVDCFQEVEELHKRKGGKIMI